MRLRVCQTKRNRLLWHTRGGDWVRLSAWPAASATGYSFCNVSGGVVGRVIMTFDVPMNAGIVSPYLCSPRG